MKLLFKFFIFFLLSTSLYSYTVRVLLSKDTENWTITSVHGMFLQDQATKKIDNSLLYPHKIILKKYGKKISISDKKHTSSTFLIKPVDGYLSFNGNEYEGVFLVTYYKKKWLLINAVELEQYLYSVLRTEGWPGWSLETYKVLAITSRSYLLYQLLFSQKQKLPYDICGTNKHQTYQGVHTTDVIKHAIEETKGIFMAHQKKPILAMFDCCCGGIIPSQIEGMVDFTKAPYLARTYSCTHCKDTKVFSWKAECLLDTFLDALVKHGFKNVSIIKDVSVLKKDISGVVQKISIKMTKKKQIIIKGKDIYGLVKGVKSYCFSLYKKGKYLIFEGFGHGHHMGLCQWGANKMILEGWTCEDVLQFYYPDIQFMKICYKLN